MDLVFVTTPHNRHSVRALVAAVEDLLPPGSDPVLRLVREAQGLEQLPEAPHLVLWSFFSAHLPQVAEELARARSLRPGDLHVAGGPHATAAPDTLLPLGFDAVCVGEGELPLRALVEHLKTTGELVFGPAFLTAANPEPGRSPLPSLDAFPPYSEAYRLHGALEITRGCPWSCAYCQTPALFPGKVRHRSLQNILGHVRHLNAGGYTHYRFVAPNALAWGGATPTNLAPIRALLEGIRAITGPSPRVLFGMFPSEVRPEFVTAEASALIARLCDNREVVVGAQSGSDTLLASMGRHHTVAHVLAAVDHLLAVDLRPIVDFILGMPGESPAMLAESLDCIDALVVKGARPRVHAFMPLPGTPWAGAPAGHLSPEIIGRFDKYTGRGQLEGAWRNQVRQSRRSRRKDL